MCVCNSYGNFTARNFSMVSATSCGPCWMESSTSDLDFSTREKCHLNEIERERRKKPGGFPGGEGREEKEKERYIIGRNRSFRRMQQRQSKIFSPTRLGATLNEIAC